MENEYNLENSKRCKSVLEIEKRLTYLVENDVNNEEIYILLKKLANIYINQNKYVYGYSGVEDVCHDVAADLWMSILQGRRVNAWIYYIGKMIKLTYVKKQKELEHEIIDTRGDPIAKDSIKRMCAASAISCFSDFEDMSKNLFLDGVSELLEKTMSHTKFKKGSKDWLSLYTNLTLSLCNELENKKQTYFRLPDHLKPYVETVKEQYKKLFRNSGFNENLIDNIDLDLEMSQYNIDTSRKETD